MEKTLILTSEGPHPLKKRKELMKILPFFSMINLLFIVWKCWICEFVTECDIFDDTAALKMYIFLTHLILLKYAIVFFKNPQLCAEECPTWNTVSQKETIYKQ